MRSILCVLFILAHTLSGTSRGPVLLRQESGQRQEGRYISGRVTEKASGRPVGQVHVRWKGTSVSVLTLADGSYRIPFRAGFKRLVYSKPGWMDRSVRVRRRSDIHVKLRKNTSPRAPAQPDEDLPPDSLIRSYSEPGVCLQLMTLQSKLPLDSFFICLTSTSFSGSSSRGSSSRISVATFRA